jgi:predicted MPP superfamily phosphohydrolase
LKPLEKITAPHYFVYGNHDVMTGKEEVIENMKNVGVIVLQNEIACFGELQIVGLNNMPADTNSFDPHAKNEKESIKSIMEKLSIDENRPAIALHHRPVGVEYLEKKKIDLLLAGHTHAGQLFPSTLIAKAVFPYNKGLYKYKDMNIFVSTGIGTAGPPVKIGTDSEIILLKLTPKN